MGWPRTSQRYLLQPSILLPFPMAPQTLLPTSTHPPGLLQLLCQLSQCLAMALPQLLHRHLMNARFLLQSLLQLCHLLFSLGPFIGEGEGNRISE